MTLSLSARPTIVAREEQPGRWDWLIDAADVGTLRMALADGLIGTAQRREPGGAFVLLAWNIHSQKRLAEAASTERKRRIREHLYPAPAGYTPRIYLPPARPRAMRTYGGYEAAHW